MASVAVQTCSGRPGHWRQLTRGQAGHLTRARLPLEASGAERSEAGLGATKEVLGSIIDFLAFNLDFLRFPYYCIRIS